MVPTFLHYRLFEFRNRTAYKVDPHLSSPGRLENHALVKRQARWDHQLDVARRVRNRRAGKGQLP